LFLLRPDIRGWKFGTIDPFPNPHDLNGAPETIPEPSAAVIFFGAAMLSVRRRAR
jgi:hypothetical protein